MEPKYRLKNDARLFKLSHDVIYVCCKGNEYIFNDNSSRFILELIDNQCSVEETESLNNFRLKIQGYMLKDWLLKKEAIQIIGDDLNQNSAKSGFSDLSQLDGENPLHQWHKIYNISHNKKIQIHFTQYKSSCNGSLDSLKVKVAEIFLQKFKEDCPLFLESSFSSVVIDIYENQAQFSVSQRIAEEQSLHIPIVLGESQVDIGPISNGCCNILNAYKQRIFIRAGSTHLLDNNIPFQVPSELPSSLVPWKNICDSLIYIIEYKITSLQTAKSYNDKVWSLLFSQLEHPMHRDDVINVSENQIFIAKSSVEAELLELPDYNSSKCFGLFQEDQIRDFSKRFSVPMLDCLSHSKIQRRDQGNDGGHRLLPASETRKNIIRLVNPTTGIIQKMVFTSISDKIFKYSARKIFGASNKAQKETANSARASGYPVSSDGKGRSAYQAQVSCIAEAIERYSANFPVLSLPTYTDAYENLGTMAIHPNEIMLFSENQFVNRQDINAQANGSMHVVPLPFNNEKPEHWTPIVNLIDVNDSKLIPTSMLGYNYIQAHQLGTVISCSNGLSSGNTITESIIQAIYEIIERDSCAIWWYNRLTLGEIDIPHSLHVYCQELIYELNKLERSFQLVQLPTDFNVSVVGAISHRRDGSSICVGLGCHHDHTVAVSRAVTEMYQMLLGETHYMKSLSLSDGNGGVEKVVKNWLMTANINEHSYLTGGSKETNIIESQKFEFLEEELEWLLRQFDERNFDVYALNFTAESVGFPVSKVFIPGMRHFWPRFAPGRLYDIPVKLGYLSKPTNEVDLNPIGFFF